MKPLALLATLLSLALMFVATRDDPASARSEPQLTVAVGDRLGFYPSVLVAGEVVTLTASVYAFYGDPGCERSDLSPGSPVTATISVPADVDLLGASSTQTVPVPDLADDEYSGDAPTVINVRWRVRIARPGAFRGQLTVAIPARSGTICEGHDDFTIAAVAGGPRFRVLEAYLDRGAAVAVVSASLPSRGMSESVARYALTDALSELQYPLGDGFGHSELDLLSLRWRGRALLVFGGGTWDGDRSNCLDFRSRARLHSGALVHYKLHFDWNANKGFALRHQSGSVRLRARPRTHAGKVCARKLPVS